jgi:hypothetical protein
LFPERFFFRESVKESAVDGDAAEVFVGKTAAFDTKFKDSPPQLVWYDRNFALLRASTEGTNKVLVSYSLAFPFPPSLFRKKLVLALDRLRNFGFYSLGFFDFIDVLMGWVMILQSSASDYSSGCW